jgi:DNA-binding Lrp family transcriptional regulator
LVEEQKNVTFRGSHQMPKKSDVPGQILNYLEARPARSSQEIASDLTIPLTTVQRHLRQLQADEQIREGYVSIAPSAKKRLHRFHIYVQTEYGELKGLFGPTSGQDPQSHIIKQIERELEQNPHCKGKVFLEVVDILMGGDYDMVIIVSSADIQPVGNFVIFVLRDIKGIRWTKTATVWSPTFDQLEEETEEPE